MPYALGATCGPRRLRRLLEGAGLAVEAAGALMHMPGIVLRAAAPVLPNGGLLRAALAAERLNRSRRATSPPNSLQPERVSPDPGPQWTVRSSLRRALEVVRAEGARSLFFKALGETVYRRLTIVELDLMDPPPLDAASLPLDFGFLAESEAAGLAVLEVPPGPAEAVERLRRGERCFVARHDRRIVSARWLATGRTAHIDYLDQELRLERGDVYLYEAFTHPDYRGRGISAAAGTRLARRLAVDGARRILAAVLPENRPGVRAFEKAGFRAVGTVGWIGLGGRRHEFLRAGTGCYG